MFETTGRALILAGLLLVTLGLVMWLSPRIPFIGNLPGDITYESNGTTISIPLTTCLLVSFLLTLILNILLYLTGR